MRLSRRRRKTRAALLLAITPLLLLTSLTLLGCETTVASVVKGLQVRPAPFSQQVLKVWSTTPTSQLSSGGDPQRDAGTSGVKIGGPQRDADTSGVKIGDPQRDAGTSGVKIGGPQRDAGISGVKIAGPQRDAGTSGVKIGDPQRDAGTSAVKIGDPQRDADTSGVKIGDPQRDAGTSGVKIGGPQRDAGTSEVKIAGPQKDAGTSGVKIGGPQRDADTSGVKIAGPQRDVGTSEVKIGDPQRDANTSVVKIGDPQRDAGISGVKIRDPQRDAGTSGVKIGDPQRDASTSGVKIGVPQRDAGISGVKIGDPQRGSSPPKAKSWEFQGISAPSVVRGATASPEGGERPAAAAASSSPSGEPVGRGMRDRALRLRQECREAGALQLTRPRPWLKRRMITRPFSVCVAPKGGSTSWRYLMKEASRQEPSRRAGFKVIVTRHPLARLASAYRDKFLNGSPLKAYNATFRRVTGSRQTWLERWKVYWLPALIHKGLVKPSPRFLEVVNGTTEAFQFVAKHVDASGRLRLKGSSRAASGYAPDVLRLATKMISTERDLGMVAAVEAGYPGSVQANLQKRLIGSSFTFVEFLEHVVWTWKIGLVDSHWTPISEMCNPCLGNYTYVLRLENPEESRYLLGLLQFQEDNVPRRHVSIGASPDQYDLRYYRDVPVDLMAEICQLYRMDFRLFGYEEIPFGRYKPGEEIPFGRYKPGEEIPFGRYKPGEEIRFGRYKTNNISQYGVKNLSQAITD